MKKIRNLKSGASDALVFIIVIIIAIVAFFIAPKFLNKKKSAKKPHEKPKSDVPYVNTYHKGMKGARAAVEASKERY